MKLPFPIKPLYVVVGVLALIALWAVFSYNSFVRQTNAIDGQWKQVEVQYQRRVDLIPNLVESVKGIQQQEQTIFLGVANARAAYAGAKTTDERAQAATNLESSLSRLLAVVENYPQLVSNQAVATLMTELAGTENRVAVERRRYNELIQAFNTSVSTIPGNILAAVFGFKSHAYFNAAAGSENAPQVNF